MIYMDIGNSNLKLARKEITGWKPVASFSHDEIEDLADRIDSLLADSESVLAVSVVQSASDRIQTLLKERARFVKIEDFPESIISYQTPKTLGIDRVLACIGARARSDGKAVIVIDAGSAVTIDFMDSSGVFQGGVIAPGLQAFQKGLKLVAPGLPEVGREIPQEWPPKQTVTAVQHGIFNGYLMMITGLIRQVKLLSPEASVWITGGDGEWIMSQGIIPNAVYDAFLVFEGLDRIGEKVKGV